MNKTSEIIERIECVHNVLDTLVTDYYGDEATEAECLALKQMLATIYAAESTKDMLAELISVKKRIG